MELKGFKINKLHETLNFELKFKNNTLILLGENGSCKTTIIKMLYYTLSLQWGKLSQYNFESIEINVDKSIFKISKEDLIVSTGAIDERVLRRLPSPIRHAVITMIDNNRGIDIQRLDELCRRYDFPVEFILQELSIEENPTLFSKSTTQINKQRKALIESMQNLKKKVEGIHVLYLPTYRRIEQELKVVLDGRIDEDDFMRNRRIMRFQENNNYTELIEFGMRDVDAAINNTLTNLKDSSRSSLNELTLGYLGDIVDKKYETTDTKEISHIDDETIHQIMNRVDDSILSKKRKDKLFNTLQDIKSRGKIRDEHEHEQVVCHYFLKLYEFHQELIKKETSIREFVAVCNRYLENKTMYYDSPSFSFAITSNYDNHDIKLFQLSSGEKQIVSLFSHLYLSNKNNCLVLIDEPELSLSVKWQKTFLEDVRKGVFCNGLIAVTHSPFIFDNSLDEYAHGIEEFRK
ncbi:MAG: AAA family ATPase [Bacteroidales bacterium]|nr:AAA family ATPase [Bacteroidales bacterium]